MVPSRPTTCHRSQVEVGHGLHMNPDAHIHGLVLGECGRCSGQLLIDEKFRSYSPGIILESFHERVQESGRERLLPGAGDVLEGAEDLVDGLVLAQRLLQTPVVDLAEQAQVEADRTVWKVGKSSFLLF